MLGVPLGFFIARSHFFTSPLPAGGCPELKLNKTLRKLWADHVIWTRQYIVDVVAELPSQEETTKRLLKNQVDIGDAVASLYGKAAGDALAALLKDHILIAADVVAAAKAHDQAALKIADAKWHENGLAIATFLHEANPENWPLDVMVAMMNDHLAATAHEAAARIEGSWQEDIHVFG
jgi:hypothetical protein